MSSNSQVVTTDGSICFISPQELQFILELAGSASAPVGRVYEARDMFTRAIALANQSQRIGPEAPPVSTPEGA